VSGGARVFLAIAPLGVLFGCSTPRASAPAAERPETPAERPLAAASESDGRYSNPILPGFYPDPSICRVGADYYLVTSSFEYFPGIPIFHSRDLVSWRQLGHVLTRPSQLALEGVDSSQGIFAPTIREHAGTFYVVSTNVSAGGSFLVTARDPAGPWSDPIWVKEPEFTMDPSLLFSRDGRALYVRHSGGEHGGAYQAELDPVTGRLLGEPRLLWRGTGGVWPEGPHLYEIGDRFFLMLAEGGTSTNHRVTIARASSPFGPFEPNPHNPVLTHADRPREPIQATGHADLVQTEAGEWWMVLLGIRRWDGQHHHLGRETFLAPVRWTDAGWPELDAPLSLEMTSRRLPPRHPWPTPEPRDDFDGATLAFDWNFVRNPRPGSWSLTERPGHLRLSGSNISLDDAGSPAFVGRRQRHFRVRVRAALDFAPTGSEQRAGLTLRANERNHHDLVLTGPPGARRVELWTRVAGAGSRAAARDVPDGPVELAIEAFADRYELSLVRGGQLEPLGTAPTAALSTEAAGGFTGVYVGMFASTATGSTMPPADFDWFEYEPLADAPAAATDARP
jgi:xylan 1,4-beta-xylosidase